MSYIETKEKDEPGYRKRLENTIIRLVKVILRHVGVHIRRVVVVSDLGKNRGLLIGQSAFAYDEILLLVVGRGSLDVYAKERKNALNKS